MLLASNVLLWGVCAVLAFAVLALARQIGVLHERIAPMGALVTDHGPAVGDVAPAMTVATLSGKPLSIGKNYTDSRATLLMFVAPSCPICRKVIPIAKSVAAAEGHRLAFIGDGEDGQLAAMRVKYGLETYPFGNAPQVGLAFHVGKLPYGVLIGSDGTIRAKGLVNSREHIESLFNADRTGFATAQDYLRSLDVREPVPA